MNKKINKKGFIFVVSCIMIIMILLIVFLTFDRYSYSDSTTANQRRLNLANDFVKGFNQDLERSIRIASFRSLIALEEHVSITGEFLNNTEESFTEVVYYGSINGTSINIMENSSIEEYLNRMNIIGERFGFEVNVNVKNINLSQSDPWYVNVNVLAEVYVMDTAGLASWNFSNEYISEVPIANLRDPIYGVFTENKFYNTIRQFPGTLGGGNATSNMEDLIEDSYYIESTNAPSFIQRFNNNLTAHPMGIESLTNIVTISDQNIDVYPDRVKVDYIYFNDLASNKRCDFENISEDYHLVLPSNRLALYGVDSINYSTSCP